MFFKAHAATEGDERVIYCEPSNENLDAQGERVLQQALAASKDHFLRFGNLDIDHKSILGDQLGIPRPELYEIGRPVEVKVEPAVMVKGIVYRGEGEACEKANFFWESLTKQTPPRQWYPSVGGRTLHRPLAGDGSRLIKAVVWTNIGFSREPVNQTVKAVSLMPFEQFAKALVSGYGTDAATFTGGRAIQPESLEGKPADATYRRMALGFLKSLGSGACAHTGSDRPSFGKIREHFEKCEGADPATARRAAQRLVKDMAAQLKKETAITQAAA